MKADDLYWLFSTIAQTLGAIVGLVGMICVYRFQNLRNARWAIMDSTANSRRRVFDAPALGQTAVEFLESWRSLKKTGSSIMSEDRQRLDDADSKLTEIFDEHAKIRNTFVRFLITDLIIIFFSILALPMCEVLVRGWKWVVWGTGISVAASFGLTIYLALVLIPPGMAKVKKLTGPVFFKNET